MDAAEPPNERAPGIRLLEPAVTRLTAWRYISTLPYAFIHFFHAIF
jgi:hypothetical protein